MKTNPRRLSKDRLPPDWSGFPSIQHRMSLFLVLLLTTDMAGFWETQSMCALNRKSVSHLILLKLKTSGQTLPIVFREKFITGQVHSWPAPNLRPTIFILPKMATRFLRVLFSFYSIHSLAI